MASLLRNTLSYFHNARLSSDHRLPDTHLSLLRLRASRLDTSIAISADDYSLISEIYHSIFLNLKMLVLTSIPIFLTTLLTQYCAPHDKIVFSVLHDDYISLLTLLFHHSWIRFASHLHESTNTDLTMRDMMQLLKSIVSKHPLHHVSDFDIPMDMMPSHSDPLLTHDYNIHFPTALMSKYASLGPLSLYVQDREHICITIYTKTHIRYTLIHVYTLFMWLRLSTTAPHLLPVFRCFSTHIETGSYLTMILASLYKSFCIPCESILSSLYVYVPHSIDPSLQYNDLIQGCNSYASNIINHFFHDDRSIQWRANSQFKDDERLKSKLTLIYDDERYTVYYFQVVITHCKRLNGMALIQDDIITIDDPPILQDAFTAEFETQYQDIAIQKLSDCECSISPTNIFDQPLNVISIVKHESQRLSPFSFTYTWDGYLYIKFCLPSKGSINGSITTRPIHPCVVLNNYHNAGLQLPSSRTFGLVADDNWAVTLKSCTDLMKVANAQDYCYNHANLQFF
jgi:hypothetical protein